MQEEDIGTDGGSLSDHRLPTQDGRIGIDGYMITDIRMTLPPLDYSTFVIPLKAPRTQRHGMVEFHMMADPARLPNDDTRPMIDEKMSAD